MISKFGFRLAGIAAASKFVVSPLPTVFTPATAETVNNNEVISTVSKSFNSSPSDSENILAHGHVR
jgi:hypothetical protein